MGSPKKIAFAIGLTIGLVEPSLAAADEIVNRATTSPNTIINVPVGSETHLVLPESGTLVIKVANPAHTQCCLSKRMEFLDPRRMTLDLDDFGGPFGLKATPMRVPDTSQALNRVSKPSPEVDQDCK